MVTRWILACQYIMPELHLIQATRYVTMGEEEERRRGRACHMSITHTVIPGPQPLRSFCIPGTLSLIVLYFNFVYEPYAVEESVRFEVCECQYCANLVLKARTRH